MAFSRAPPPTRGQQNLLGFMQMSSGQRFSLEQLMVESGRLEPEQTLNHRAWGPLSVLSASRKDVLAARIGGPMGHFPRRSHEMREKKERFIRLFDLGKIVERMRHTAADNEW